MIPTILAFTLCFVAVLALAGRVPLRYSARNLTVRWKTTLVTALAFTSVIALLVVMLAFVNGMYRLTEGSGQPGNVIVLSERATDEVVSNLPPTEIGELENQPGIVRENGRPVASRETYLVINQPIPHAPDGRPKRRFLQVRGTDDPRLAARIHGLSLYRGGRWFSEAGVVELAGRGGLDEVEKLAGGAAPLTRYLACAKPASWESDFECHSCSSQGPLYQRTGVYARFSAAGGIRPDVYVGLAGDEIPPPCGFPGGLSAPFTGLFPSGHKPTAPGAQALDSEKARETGPFGGPRSTSLLPLLPLGVNAEPITAFGGKDRKRSWPSWNENRIEDFRRYAGCRFRSPQSAVYRAYLDVGRRGVRKQSAILLHPRLAHFTPSPSPATGKAQNRSVQAVEAVLGEGVARELGRDRSEKELAGARNRERLDVGDTFQLGDRTWTVVGIMQSSGSTFNSEVWAKRSLISGIFGKETYTSLVVRTKDAAAARKLKDFYNTQYEQAAVQAQVETDYYSSLGETNRQFLVAIVFVTVVMSIGGVFGVMNTMFAAISQRTRDIGVLRLLGFARWQILVTFLLESLLIAAVGGLLGCLLGSLADGWSATSIVSSGPGGGKSVVLRLAVDGDILAVGLLLALSMGIAGGLVPALSAMRLKPLDALR